MTGRLAKSPAMPVIRDRPYPLGHPGRLRRSLAIWTGTSFVSRVRALKGKRPKTSESRRPSERRPPLQASQNSRQSRVRFCDAGSKHRTNHRKKRGFFALARHLSGDRNRSLREASHASSQRIMFYSTKARAAPGHTFGAAGFRTLPGERGGEQTTCQAKC